MKQTFVNNIEELMTANENQRIKINYLESEKQKRQEYLSGLRESIMLNKQTLIVLNQEGPNDQAITASSKENVHLIRLNQRLYAQNRQLNAQLLMEQQLRVEERAFNTERIAEFENRITDLRKYLHDKEETFSAVVTRLKKYEEWNQKPLSEKIQDTETLKKITNEVLTQVTAQRNMLKAKFQEVFPNSQRFNILSQTLKNPVNVSRFINQINQFPSQNKAFSQSDSPRQKLADLYVSQQKNAFSKQSKQSASQLKQTQITKQLMRLLKKQKINNEILQTALHSAIEKNQELLKINQNLDTALHNLEKKMQKLIAQNHFYKMRVKEFAYGYGKKYVLQKWKETGDQPAFHELFRLNFEIKDEQNEEVSTNLYRDLLKESMKDDVKKYLMMPMPVLKSHIKNVGRLGEEEKIAQMTTNDNTRLNEKIVKSKWNEKERKEEKVSQEENEGQKMLVRSASEPRMFVKWDETADDEESEVDSEEMVIQQF